MRRGWKVVLLMLVSFALLIPWAAAESIADQQKGSLDTSELEEAAPDSLDEVDALELTSLSQGLETIREELQGAVDDVLAASVRSGGILLLIVLFCSLADQVAGPMAGMVPQAVRLAGTAAVAMTALSDMTALIGLGRETIQSLSDFTLILVPTLTTAAVASGSITSAPVRQAATLLVSSLLTKLISNILLPLTYLYAAGCLASAALDGDRLRPLCKLLRWCVTTVLSGLLLAYTAYLAIAGGAASTADAATMKAAQLAISSMVPVVGGILSDATSTVLSGASVLRSSIGLFGTLGVLGFCAVPFLRLGMRFLLYKLVAALSAAVTDHPVSRLIQDLGSVFSLVMGMAGTCALVTLISLLSTITAVVS